MASAAALRSRPGDDAEPARLEDIARRRITRELHQLKNNSSGADSMVKARWEREPWEWAAKLKGPEESPYARGVFKVHVTFSVVYPFKPPELRLETKIWHPNFPPDGRIYLDSDRWDPSYTVEAILYSIVTLLRYPDNRNSELRNGYAKTTNKGFETTARAYTDRYAVEPWD
uniref:UBC core domain-containing protein n=1 Tax=Zooxanthella nutricula TaxID=1333877 RepID=A0A7S2KBB2_9DINO